MPLLVAFAAVVYGRARSEAHEGLKSRLLVRARALSGLVELDGGAIEMEVPLAFCPEYDEGGERAYFRVHDVYLKQEFLRCKSLGDFELPAPPAWKKGDVTYTEIDSGPHGRPCVMVTVSFTVLADRPDAPDDDDEPDEDAAEIPEEQLRFQVQVALDVTERDDRLASLAWFLVGTGFTATLLALLGGGWLARRLVRPLREMTETAKGMSPDDPERRLEPDRVVAELDSLAVTLNSAFDRLTDALEQQRRFIGDASHELRTPATILLSNAELLLRRERTPEEYRRGLERQVGTARRMAALITDLLTLARADAGRCAIDRARLDLAHVVESVCDEHATLAEEREISLDFRSEPQAHMEGDPQRLSQLVSNLVSNAVKFAPDGGHVDVTVATTGVGVVLSVTDDGPGISEEHQQRVFERFYRVDEERSARRTGTGLGLAIAAWVAEVHGGRIELESRPGEGSTFLVTFPRAA